MNLFSIHVPILLCLSILVSFDGYAQVQIRTMSVKGLYTSSSRLFPTPEATDEFARHRYNSLNHIFGYGADLRYGIPSLGLIIGASVEYLEKNGDFFTRYQIDDEVYPVPTVDGYFVIPVELTGYFLIPVSSERVQFYIGGGAGVYFGRRLYEVGGVQSKSLERSMYPGIHVVSGIDYYFHPRIGLRGELKFRDPDIETHNRFNEETIEYKGRTFNLPEGDIPSRINVDGIVFSFGLVFRL
jgi:hypothetical protein